MDHGSWNRTSRRTWYQVEPLKSADEIAEEMLNNILPDLPFESGNEVVVLLSGLGATPVMEQYIVYNKVEEILKRT